MSGQSSEREKLTGVIRDLTHAAHVLSASFPGESNAARQARESVARLIEENVRVLGQVLTALAARVQPEDGDRDHAGEGMGGRVDTGGRVGASGRAAAGNRLEVNNKAEATSPVEVRHAYGYRVEIYTAAPARRTCSSIGRFEGDCIRLELLPGLPSSERERHIERLVRRLVAARRLPRLRERILRLAKEKFPEFNLRIGEIRFHEQKRRWGSCSSRGNINLSYRLLDVPDELLIYVCIHELAHLIEFNHSPRFWALVERADPDYRIHREQLRQLEASQRLPGQSGADQYGPGGSGREAAAADELPDD